MWENIWRKDKFLNGYSLTENRQSLCGSNVRWKTVPESTASSGKSTIANSHQSGCQNDNVIRRRRSSEIDNNVQYKT